MRAVEFSGVVFANERKLRKLSTASKKGTRSKYHQGSKQGEDELEKLVNEKRAEP